MKICKLVICLWVIQLIGLGNAQANEGIKVVAPHQFNFLISAQRLTDCTELFKKIDEYVKQNCVAANDDNRKCFYAGNAILFEANKKSGVLPFVANYVLDSVQQLIMPPSYDVHRLDVVYGQMAQLNPKMAQVSLVNAQKSQLVNDDLAVLKKLNLDADIQWTENEQGMTVLRVTNRYQACMIENKKMQLAGMGSVYVLTTHPMGNARFDIIQDSYKSAQEVFKTNQSNSRKQFMFGLKVGKILLQKLPNLSAEQLEKVSNGVFNVLIADHVNDVMLRSDQIDSFQATVDLLQSDLLVKEAEIIIPFEMKVQP